MDLPTSNSDNRTNKKIYHPTNRQEHQPRKTHKNGPKRNEKIENLSPKKILINLNAIQTPI